MTLINVVAVFVLIFAAQVYGGDADTHFPYKELINESGVVVGVGSGSIAEGYYNPVLLIYHVGWDLNKALPCLEKCGGTFSAYIEPQVNPVFNPATDIEFGVGVGIKYRYAVTDRFSWYVMGSVGPHFITVKTRDQANGFIFSDTIGAGCSYMLTGRWSIDFEYRFRHMSNASMRDPNLGINNNFIAIGYTRHF
jgi:opacity protein-like surface antigen